MTYGDNENNLDKGPDTPPPAGAIPPIAATSGPKVRRVGALTMALCLIAVGVLLIVSIFVPIPRMLPIFRFFPVVLILFGLEILLANIWAQKKPEVKIKYDFLSIFLCMILIGGSLVAALIPQWANMHYNQRQNDRALMAQMDEEAYEALAKRGDVSLVSCYIESNVTDYADGITLAELPSTYYVRTEVYFKGDFATQKEFEKACAEVLTALRGIVAHIDGAGFYSYNQTKPGDGYYGDAIYDLWLDGQFQMNYDASEMHNYTTAYQWDSASQCYMSEQEWEAANSEPVDVPDEPEDAEYEDMDNAA